MYPLPLANDSLLSLVGNAARLGAARIGAFRWEWDIGGRCTAPVTLEAHADRKRQPISYRDITDGLGWSAPTVEDPKPHSVILHVRCRKCPTCRRERALRWFHRGLAEYDAAGRTWMLTLTASSQQHFLWRLKAEKALEEAGVSWSTATAEVKYKALAQQMGNEFCKYVKRLRKTGYSFRYLMVYEPHEGKRGGTGENLGNPHIHALIFEAPWSMVTKRALEKCWRSRGFGAASTHVRLVSPEDRRKEVWYVVKYLTKTGARLRASLRFGLPKTISDHSFSVKNASKAVQGVAGGAAPRKHELVSCPAALGTDFNPSSKAQNQSPRMWASEWPVEFQFTREELITLRMLTDGTFSYPAVPLGPNFGISGGADEVTAFVPYRSVL